VAATLDEAEEEAAELPDPLPLLHAASAVADANPSAASVKDNLRL
jgi:hypothetical protein